MRYVIKPIRKEEVPALYDVDVGLASLYEASYHEEPCVIGGNYLCPAAYALIINPTTVGVIVFRTCRRRCCSYCCGLCTFEVLDSAI